VSNTPQSWSSTLTRKVKLEDTQKTSTPMSKALSGHSYNTELGQHGQELTLQAVKHSSSGLSIQFMQTKTVHPGTWSYFELQARNKQSYWIILLILRTGLAEALFILEIHRRLTAGIASMTGLSASKTF